jgi:mannitol/fructose-specific phosphotransferase system IIA component (Ntr-type)
MNNIVRLSEQFSEKYVVIHSASETAEAIILEMIAMLSAEIKQDVREDIFSAILDKERKKSTGIGHGIAVPHTRTALIKQPYCIAATTKKGIEFSSLDGRPVFLFLMIISPEFTVGPHLNLIGSIGHLISKNPTISADLNEALTPEEFIKILKEREDKYII